MDIDNASNLHVKKSAGPTSETWELVRPTIKRLYLDEDKSLPQVMEIMQRDHDFRASIKMYKRRLTLWKLDGKYLKRNEVKQIARLKIDRNAAGKASTFHRNGRQIDMQNVHQYLHKHGYSSLEDFLEAASPGKDANDIRCQTPLPVPASSTDVVGSLQTAMQLYQHSDVDRGDLVTGNQPDHSSHDGRILQRTAQLEHQLALSPETRSRRLPSFSHIPRSLSSPRSLLIPERLMSIVSSYTLKALGSQAWLTASDGFLVSVKDPKSEPEISVVHNCASAIEHINDKKYVQARQLLAVACSTLEYKIRYECPDLVSTLLHTHNWCLRNGSATIANLLLRHAVQSAKQFLGDEHELRRASYLLLDLESILPQLYTRILQCQFDVLENQIGAWHNETLAVRSKFTACVDTSEAVHRSNALLAAVEKRFSEGDEIWFTAMIQLGWSTFDDGQYDRAREIAEILLDVLSKFQHPSRYKVDALRLMCYLAAVAQDLNETEQFIRLCSGESVRCWGWKDAETINNMLYHVRILQKLGRVTEATELESKIEELLGPPEITELLESPAE